MGRINELNHKLCIVKMIQELFLESKMIFVHEVSASDRSLTL